MRYAVKSVQAMPHVRPGATPTAAPGAAKPLAGLRDQAMSDAAKSSKCRCTCVKQQVGGVCQRVLGSRC